MFWARFFGAAVRFPGNWTKKVKVLKNLEKYVCMSVQRGTLLIPRRSLNNVMFVKMFLRALILTALVNIGSTSVGNVDGKFKVPLLVDGFAD